MITAILILFALELVLLTIAARTGGLTALIVVNMTMIANFSGKMIDFGDWQSNVGNIFYASVFMCQVITIEREGKTVALRRISNVMLGLVAIMMLTQALQLVPSMAGEEEITRTIRSVGNSSIRAMMASVLAFTIGQWVFLSVYSAALLEPFPIRCLLATAVGQAIDSLIFFPIVFGFDVHLTEIMLVGFIFKLALALLAMPVLWLLIHSQDSHDPTVTIAVLSRLDEFSKRIHKAHDKDAKP